MVQVLSKDEVGRLLEVPDLRCRSGRRDRALLSTMVLGGLRIAEASGLRRDEVFEVEGVVRLTFAGKGGKRRTVTLPTQAAAALLDHLNHSTGEFVFSARTDRSAALSPRAARYITQKCFASAGLPDWAHPHSLRHTCATMLLRATNGDMRTVQRTLGHSSPVTTAKFYDGYDSTDSDRAAVAMERWL
jgi:integrase/recombinase XerD